MRPCSSCHRDVRSSPRVVSVASDPPPCRAGATSQCVGRGDGHFFVPYLTGFSAQATMCTACFDHTFLLTDAELAEAEGVEA